MLATRLLTVFVAAAFLIPFSLYANALGFSVLAAVICGLVLWEWLSLTSIGPAMRWLLLSVWVGLVVGTGVTKPSYSPSTGFSCNTE